MKTLERPPRRARLQSWPFGFCGTVTRAVLLPPDGASAAGPREADAGGGRAHEGRVREEAPADERRSNDGQRSSGDF